MYRNSITLYHQLLDQKMPVPDTLFSLIKSEHGVDAELAARNWYSQVRMSRPQE
ncbi:hypothetical protein FIU96_12225 [Marinobacter sp. THAF39]|nr:hypothetical protein FIV08_12310 [Marinobacter sp. THAF197a]QFT51392.1 hypothetical protein FIU96_12225 [Marinobacter sp. THAF39]